MTFEEYDKQIDELGSQLKANWSDELYDKVSQFQHEHMTEFLEEYRQTVGDDDAKDICCQLLEYAIKDSTSGNAIVDVDFISTKDEASELESTILGEIGKYLLDDCQVYQEKSGQWVADVMFGGSYVPYWDGWREE